MLRHTCSNRMIGIYMQAIQESVREAVEKKDGLLSTKKLAAKTSTNNHKSENNYS